MKQGLSVMGIEDLSSVEDKSAPAGDRRVQLLKGVGEVRAALIVIELQVTVVGERHLEAEDPVSGDRLAVVEVRLPSVKVSRQANRMIRKLARFDVVRSAPDEVPFLRRFETDTHLKQLARRQKRIATPIEGIGEVRVPRASPPPLGSLRALADDIVRPGSGDDRGLVGGADVANVVETRIEFIGIRQRRRRIRFGGARGAGLYVSASAE